MSEYVSSCRILRTHCGLESADVPGDYGVTFGQVVIHFSFVFKFFQVFAKFAKIKYFELELCNCSLQYGMQPGIENATSR